MASTGVYVGNLAPDVTEADLRTFLASAGTVTDVSLRKDARTGSAFAYVSFSTPEQATRALSTLAYTPLKGQPVRLGPVVTDTKARKLGLGNLHIAGIPTSWTERDVATHFGTVGPVTSVKVARDSTTGAPLGYAYCAFETQELADRAIAAFHDTTVEGATEPLVVRMFTRSAQRKNEVSEVFTNLYVKNLRDAVDDATLAEEFKQFGAIKSQCIKIDAQGRKFAFVAFNDANAARAAVEVFNGKPNESLTDSELFVSKAQTRQERVQALSRQFRMEAQLAQAPNGGAPMPPQGVPHGAPMPPQGYMMYAPPPPPMMMQHPQGLYHGGAAANAANGTPPLLELFFQADSSIPVASLRGAFNQFGRVVNFQLLRNKSAEGPHQNGFVSYSNPMEASAALEGLRLRVIQPNTRPLKVSPRHQKGGKGNANGNGPPMAWGGPPPSAPRGHVGSHFNGPPRGGNNANGNGHAGPPQAMPQQGAGAGAPPQGGRGSQGPPADLFPNIPSASAQLPLSRIFSQLSGDQRKDAVAKEITKQITSRYSPEV